MTGLFLHGNSLASLPDGVFDELTMLTRLNLNGNSLAPLPAGIFDGLTALRRLELERNSLASLPAGVFDNFTELQGLLLKNNRLASLPDDIFDPLTELTELELQGNTGAPFSPVANAGTDRSAATGATVTLAGEASGAWGDNVTWAWTQVDGPSSNTAVSSGGVTLTDARTATPSFTAPDAATTLHFRLVVTPVPGASNAHGREAGAADWVTIAVAEFIGGARPTVANAIPNQSAQVGVPFSYTFPENTFADADAGDALTYRATGSENRTLGDDAMLARSRCSRLRRGADIRRTAFVS